MTPTHAVVLTPSGRSAVAVVEVTGPDSIAAVDRYFLAANRKPLAQQPTDAIRFGRWRDPMGEELVVCRTGDETVEVHCHGGVAAVGAVMADLVEAGCVEQSWSAAIEATASTIEAEARLALAECQTDRTAAILLDQLAGALRSAVIGIIQSLRDGELPKVDLLLTELIERSACGLHLTRPWKVVLAGPPNVGKSSLINTLVGYERAIVYDQPGVTRDVVTAAAAIAGWPVELADTAGLRTPRDAIEASGIELARTAAADADLLLLVEAYGPEFVSPPGTIQSDVLLQALGLPVRDAEHLLRVANKADLAAESDANDPLTGDLLMVSATTGQGMAELVEAIGRWLVPDPPPARAAVVFTVRQGECLWKAKQAIEQADAAGCYQALLALLSDRGQKSSQSTRS
ncbi:MAG: GTPase [Planctomycetota bacterium]